MQENPLFSTAADFVNNTSRHIFLTGKAGTGKTTFLKYIKNQTRKKAVVVAPTGVAAINAGGVTMHSLFQLPLGPFVPDSRGSSNSASTDQYTLFKNLRVSEEKRELFRDLELLIIDEVSMVRCDMLDATDAILRYFRKTPDTPFGGVQVLYIGDLFQLPPVMPDSQWSLLCEYYASPFFFHARAVQQAPPVYIELKKIYRQSQQAFIDILNRIRNAVTRDEDLATLNARRDAPLEEGVKYITLTTHNYKADKINADELARLPGDKFEFKGVVEGEFPEKTLPTDPLLQLKEGAQVMFIRNDKSDERRYYNGKIATVKSIEKDAIRVITADAEEELLLEKETWENIRYSYNQENESIDEEKLGSFTQYPIRLAWAITIHKSQGLTFRNAIIDAGDSFAPGQVYVALSRCTSLEGLVLKSPITRSSISTDPLVLEFARHEAEEDELARILAREKRAYQNELLIHTFDLTKLIEILRAYIQYVAGKKLPDMEGTHTMARSMFKHAEELQQVVLKFQLQVKTLLDKDDEEKLKLRILKAIEYFSDHLTKEIVQVLDDHLEQMRGVKKVKSYLKYVRQLRNAVARKINAIAKVQHGEVLFNPGAVEIALMGDIPSAGGDRAKAEKGSSIKETLSLLKSGLKPFEIAEKRKLALGTIEGHMALLIKQGDLDIHECMTADRLTTIVSAIREANTMALTPVRQKLGEDFSYGEIRAVVNHIHFLAEANNASS